MIDKECCCTCYFGEMLTIEEAICQHESYCSCIISHADYWSCLKWKKLELQIFSQFNAGFGLYPF